MRPHSKKRIDEIESLVAHWTNDPTKLRELLSELGHRTTSRAQSLRLRVQQLIAEGSRSQNTGSGSGDSRRNPQDGHDLSEEVKRLRAELMLRRREVSTLQDQNASLARSLAAERKKAAGSGSLKAYDLLQVQPDLPDFALKALRRVYQKAYHPDQCRDMDPGEANARFVAFETAFDEIESSRKFR
ncbi:J domain-containing protein [Paracoccus actinidiae]|uniref:J domain-containing protein n=1 Tax=Paracoccus actinidiae TaxID=3064531 RepID=UPI0027D27B1B|nr:J domain-containing protein [Paracoccus sp. M09]